MPRPVGATSGIPIYLDNDRITAIFANPESRASY